MAENIKIKIDVDSSSIDSLVQKMNKLGSEIKTATDDGVVKELNNELSNTERELQNIGTEASKLSNKFSDVNDKVEQVAKKDFSQVSGSLSKVAGGLGAVATAAALAFGGGDDANEFFKTMAVGATITMGVVGAIEGITGAIQLLGGVTKIQAGIQKTFNLIMAANPIGLVVVAIGLLVAAFIAFKKPIIDFISNWENLKTVILLLLGPIGWIILAYQKLFGEEAKIEAKREAAALAEKKRAKESIDRHRAELKRIDEQKNAKIKALDETVSALQLEKETLEAEGKASFAVALQILEAEKEKTTAVLDANRLRIQSMLDYYETELAASGQSEEEFKKYMKARGIDVDALKEKTDKIIKDNEDAVQRSENAITKLKREELESQTKDAIDAVEEISDAEQKRIDAKRKSKEKEQKAEEDFFSALEKANQEYSDSLLTKQQIEEKAVTDKYSKLIADAVKYDADTLNIEELKRKKLQEIKDKYDAIDLANQKVIDDKKLEDEKNKKAAELELETQHREDMFSIINDSLSSIETLSQLLTGNEIDRIKSKQQAGERLSNAEERKLKRDIAMQKAFAVAKIAVDTAMSLTSAIAGATASAAATGPGAVAFTPVFIASQIATVLGAVASAAAILGAPTPSIGGGGSSSGSGGSSIGIGSGQPQQTPGFNLYGQPNDGSESGASDNTSKNRTQTIRAVVSWNDIDAITRSNMDLNNEMTL